MMSNASKEAKLVYLGKHVKSLQSLTDSDQSIINEIRDK